MKKLTLLALFLCPSAQGQEHRLSMEAGGTSMVRQDLIFSPNIHRSISPLYLGLTWEKKDTQALLLRLGLQNAQASPPFDYSIDGETFRTASHSFVMSKVAFRKGWTFVDNAPIRLIAGFQADANMQLMNYQYGRIGSFGYYFQSGVGPYIQGSYTWSSKNTLLLRGGQSVLAWTARSPYLVNDDEFIENISSHRTLKMFSDLLADGSVKTLLDYQDVEAEARYSRRFTRRWEAGAAYRFNYLYVEKPRSIKSFHQGVFLNLTYSL